ncbi:ComEA family DNA-binding protein [Corynebacterium tapiri]
MACAAVAVAAVVAIVIGYVRTPPPVVPPAIAGNTTSAAPDAEIVVSVVGAVHKPGLVRLNTGDRVADAIAAAGGQLPEADPAALNQAQLLVDGQQIVVPLPGAPPVGAASSTSTGGSVSGNAGAGTSLNTADAAALEELDGVGQATAAAIIAYREEHGGFTSIDQLLDVKGIGPAKFAAIKDEVTL